MSFRSRFTRSLYDPEWVLGQIKDGFPNMSDADKATALEEACHALIFERNTLSKVEDLTCKLAAEFGYELR
jgi:hypothetical protein